jgi:hypothetical protein
MAGSIHPRAMQRAVEFRADSGAGDTIPEPELAIAIVIAFSRSAVTLPAANSPVEGNVTARYGDDELDGLRGPASSQRTLRHARVPASLLARRSFGPPLPRTDDE